MNAAQALIEQLALEPHPEGGWYRETWRAPAAPGERAGATAIHFLLEAGQESHWHRVDAAEIWLWHAGDRLALRLADDRRGPVETVVLGPPPAMGHVAQHVVPANCWQAAAGLDGEAGFVLLSCVVAPGFEFAGFTLAPQGWEPGC